MIRVITYCLVIFISCSNSYCQYNLVLQTPRSIVNFQLPSEGLDSILVFQSDRITMNYLASSSYTTLFDSVITSYTKHSDSSSIFMGEIFNSRRKIIGFSYDFGGTWSVLEAPFRPSNSLQVENNLIHLVDEKNHFLTSSDLVAFDTIGKINNSGNVISFEYVNSNEIYATTRTINSNVLSYSNNKGQDWRAIKSSPKNYIQQIIDLSEGVAVLFEANSFDIYTEQNVLKTKVRFSASHFISDILIGSDGVIFCAGSRLENTERSGFVYISEDNGESWVDISPKDYTSSVLAIKLRGDTVYLANDFKQILKSRVVYKDFGHPLAKNELLTTTNNGMITFNSGSSIYSVRIPFKSSRGEISIFNLQGSIIQTSQYHNNSVVSMPNLASGIYYYMIYDKSGATYKDKLPVIR